MKRPAYRHQKTLTRKRPHYEHMDFRRWEPIYEEILADFGFSRAEDERAARILSGLLDRPNPDILRKRISGSDVLVCGNAPSLMDELSRIDLSSYVIIAADGATSVLLSLGRIPDITVTDLDADNMDDIVKASRCGSITVVHAHGDNIPALEKYVPQLKQVVGTTQAAPLKNVCNFGGFTDGDRCVFLAAEFGAGYIELAGFDFEDSTVGEIKRKKLKWAKRLIEERLGTYQS